MQSYRHFPGNRNYRCPIFGHALCLLQARSGIRKRCPDIQVPDYCPLFNCKQLYPKILLLIWPQRNCLSTALIFSTWHLSKPSHGVWWALVMVGYKQIHLGVMLQWIYSQSSEGWRRKRISHHQQEKSQAYQEPCRKSSSVSHKASKTGKTINIGMARENPAPGMLQDTRQGHGQAPGPTGPEILGILGTGHICTTQFWVKKITEEVHTAVLGTKSPAWGLGMFFQHLVQMQISAVLHHSHLQPLCAPLV